MSPTNTLKQASAEFFQQAYEIQGSVGRGRNSIVYLARTKNDSEDIALKVLIAKAKAPEEVISRMRREALAMLSCVHPNIVRLRDYVTDGEFCYLAMEYVERGDLRTLMEAQGRAFEPELVLTLMSQALSGLERIHLAGIIHRDIKPDNLLLTKDLSIKIADFGVAILPNEELRLENKSDGVGTFDYLAPELLQDGISNESTDVYSLAVTFYELLSGHLPFGGGSFTEQIAAKMSGNVLLLPEELRESNPGLQEFLERALRPEVGQRYSSAQEFLEALEAFRNGTWNPKQFKVKPKLEVVKHGVVSELTAHEPESLAPAVQEELPEFSRVGVEAISSRLPYVALSSALAVVLVPIIMFLFLGGSNRLGQASPVAPAVTQESKQAKANFSALLEGTYVGTIEGLLPDGQSFSLVATPAEGAAGEEAVMLAVGLSGWTPLVVTEAELKNTSELLLSSGGLRISLRLDEERAAQEARRDYVLKGTVTEQLTGRSGDWVIW